MTESPRKDEGRITTPGYWEGIWAGKEIPRPIDPSHDVPENYYYQRVHELLTEIVGGPTETAGKSLIEIGCGGSRWLPYFAKNYGYVVHGIDYSETGLALAQSILRQSGFSGRLVLGDFFSPPSDWLEQHDVVVSFGLVEHFESTAHAVAACSRYLRPGGRIFTLTPTMRGLYGLAYRLLRPDVYRKHRPMSREALVAAHERAGLEVIRSGYLLGMPGVITKPQAANLFKRSVFRLSQLYYRLERRGMGLPPNALTSPYVFCAARKPV